MPKAIAGETLTLEKGKAYVVVSEDEDNFEIEVYDTLDYEDNMKGSVVIACLIRGFIEAVIKTPDLMAELGAKALRKEGVLIDDEPEVELDDLPTDAQSNLPATIENLIILSRHQGKI